MSERFDWQTEVEEWMGDSLGGTNIITVPRRWLIVPLILLGIISAGALIF